MADTPWICCACRHPITFAEDARNGEEIGISLSDDTELQICQICWGLMPIADRLEAARRWRSDRVILHVATLLGDWISARSDDLPGYDDDDLS